MVSFGGSKLFDFDTISLTFGVFSIFKVLKTSFHSIPQLPCLHLLMLIYMEQASVQCLLCLVSRRATRARYLVCGTPALARTSSSSSGAWLCLAVWPTPPLQVHLRGGEARGVAARGGGCQAAEDWPQAGDGLAGLMLHCLTVLVCHHRCLP